MLGVAAAVPAVLLPTAAAQARRLPAPQDAASLALGSLATAVTVGPSSTPGLKLSLTIVEPGDTVTWMVEEVLVDGKLMANIDPSAWIVTNRQTFPMVVSPVQASGTVQVAITYVRGDQPRVRLPPVPVKVVAAQAFEHSLRHPKPPRPPKPPKPPKPPHGLPH